MKLSRLLPLLLSAVALAPSVTRAQVSFPGTELLGRPTTNSVTVNVVAASAIEAYFEYGTQSGLYAAQTSVITAAANQSLVAVMNGLLSNTHYFYRMVYRQTGATTWIPRDEHAFWTQRPPGSTFTFTVTSDSHINVGGLGNASVFNRTLQNIGNDHPDFHLDLGDTFAMDNVTTQAQAYTAYLNERPFMGLIAHSVPIFLVLGNHEEEEGWHLDDTGNPATSKPVMGANARRRYFLNPYPDPFYSGNPDNSSVFVDGDHLTGDYYAFEWGDALFVAIDPYWYSLTKPFTGNLGGGEGSDVGSGDRWDWTLGRDQYEWLKRTLENSHAKFKFIFAHQIVGGTEDYGRGGANAAPLVEWGGNNTDGITWGFDARRPGWSSTVRQLLIDNHVTAFFHGHDHEFTYEQRDGLVYQLVPMAADAGNSFGFQNYHETDPYTIRVLPNSGHLRVSVSPSKVTVDYVRSFVSGGTNGQVAYTYDISDSSVPPPPLPPPALTGISPASGLQGQSLPVTLAGTNFVSGASCGFGSGITVNSCAFGTASQLAANITIAAAATAGTRTVTVTNPDGQSAGLANSFTVTQAPPPPPPPPPTPMAAAYAFSEGLGLTTADLSGNANGGLLQNGVAWTTLGKYGGALSFDGNDDYVSVPDSASLDLGTSGTIEAWVKLNAINRWNGILAKGNANSDPAMNYALEVSNANRFVCTLGSGSAARILTATTSVTTATFYHAACVWNGTQLQLYINGALNTSVTQNLTPAANTSPLYIGQYGGNADRISGLIDEVRIYNRALAQAEIQSDMNTALAPAGPPPSVTGLNPPSGMQGAAMSVAISGGNFLSGATCSFGAGVTVNACAFNSAAQLTASIAISLAATAGSRAVTVINPDGQSATMPAAFVIDPAPPPPAPVLSSLTPIAGQQTQTLAVTLAGANFLSPAACNFGAGITVNSCVVNSPSQISAGITITTGAATGLRGVTVTNPDGQSATLPSAFTVNAAPPPPPMSAAYSLNAGSGSAATDLSGNGNNGTLQNGVTWTAAGKYGGALGFDGNDDFVSVPDSATLDLGSSGTIEAWVKLNAINRWNGILAKGNANSDPAMNYALEVSNANRFVCTLGSGSAARILTATTSVTTATFYHAACVWNGAQLLLYINGVLNTSVTQNLTPAANTSPLYVGQYGGNVDRTSGVIDEVRIYNRAHSAAEITADMNTALVP